MGKRKAAAKPPTMKQMYKLDMVFSCPFCNHGSIVECRIIMENLIGEAPLQMELWYVYGYVLNIVVSADGEMVKLPCYCGTPDCQKRLY